MFFESYAALMTAIKLNCFKNPVILFLCVSFIVLTQTGYALLFKKEKLSPWLSLVPVYNLYLFYRELYQEKNYLPTFVYILGSEILTTILVLMKTPYVSIAIAAGLFGFFITICIYNDIIKAFGFSFSWKNVLMIFCPWAFLIYFGLEPSVQFVFSEDFDEITDSPQKKNILIPVILLMLCVVTAVLLGLKNPVCQNNSVKNPASNSDIISNSSISASSSDIASASPSSNASSGTDIEKASGTDLPSSTPYVGLVTATDIN